MQSVTRITLAYVVSLVVAVVVVVGIATTAYQARGDGHPDPIIEMIDPYASDLRIAGHTAFHVSCDGGATYIIAYLPNADVPSVAAIVCPR